MTVSPEDFQKAIEGEADDDLRIRVLEAVRRKDPAVMKLIRARQLRAAAILGLLKNAGEMGTDD
jgi:hypothetical protein